MTTFSEELTRLENAKVAIRKAIRDRGTVVSDDEKLDIYPDKIKSICVEGTNSYALITGVYQDVDSYSLTLCPVSLNYSAPFIYPLAGPIITPLQGEIT